MWPRILNYVFFATSKHFRLDSAYGSDLYTEKDKMDWLNRLQDMGVTNIEMEAPEFAAFCKRMNVPALLICVTLLNRMEGDQVRKKYTTILAPSVQSQLYVSHLPCLLSSVPQIECIFSLNSPVFHVAGSMCLIIALLVLTILP